MPFQIEQSSFYIITFFVILVLTPKLAFKNADVSCFLMMWPKKHLGCGISNMENDISMSSKSNFINYKIIKIFHKLKQKHFMVK